MGNQTSFKPGNRLSPKMVRGSDGKFATKAPTPRLVWTDVDAPETAARLHEGSGMVLYEYMRVPTAHRPLPPNLLDAHAPPTPSETAKLSRGEIIALTAMSVIGIALIVSGLVWL
jgi:hypothetical protein